MHLKNFLHWTQNSSWAFAISFYISSAYWSPLNHNWVALGAWRGWGWLHNDWSGKASPYSHGEGITSICCQVLRISYDIRADAFGKANTLDTPHTNRAWGPCTRPILNSGEKRFEGKRFTPWAHVCRNGYRSSWICREPWMKGRINTEETRWHRPSQ